MSRQFQQPMWTFWYQSSFRTKLSESIMIKKNSEEQKIQLTGYPLLKMELPPPPQPPSGFSEI